jgi:hypothetical protein
MAAAPGHSVMIADRVLAEGLLVPVDSLWKQAGRVQGDPLEKGRSANFRCDVRPSQLLHFSTRAAENSGRTAGTSLFFRSPNRRRPRISAENEMSMADDLPQNSKNSQKRAASYDTPAGFAHLMDASEH